MMRGILTAALVAGIAGAQAAEPAAPNAALARMPVREITVFKDGNSFVLREGRLPTDASGDVLMDDLPTPILGTFWVYSTDARTRVASVSARQRRVLIERTALTIPQLIEANPGAEVGVSISDEQRFLGRIVGVPVRTAEEMERTSPPNTGESLPAKAEIVVLDSPDGATVTAMNRIRDITFRGEMKRTLAAEEFRNLLTVRLDGEARRANATANLGMMYVQRGVRWTPAYKVTLDGKGGVTLDLQATISNDDADLENVTMNLVVGVPSFAFDKTPDPMSLQQTFAQVVSAGGYAGRGDFGLSNAIMTQAPGFASFDRAAAPLPTAPEVTGGDRTEDLFVFTVKNVSVRKGERIVVPVSRRALRYKDVYTLLLPFGPPTELRQGIANEQQAQVARMLASPKVQHKVRLTNGREEPLTTAPALILLGEKVLGQGLLTYTPMGADVDLDITAAVDVTVRSTERETGRVANAHSWRNTNLARVEVTGGIALNNHRDAPVDLEVTRYVMGDADSASHDGRIEKVNVYDDLTAAEFVRPTWWGYYSWPHWWPHVNGIARITWTITLPPGQSADLSYTWHYFWE